ncbi:MAG: acetoin utilization deacetylase AcuC-like enzyme [Akkermansiaceae bacterium]|jgi:acetoin utilization deacetylase AcuC-like enzyme
MLPLFYDPIDTEGIDPTARFPRDRDRLLVGRLIGRSDIEIRRPRLATRGELILDLDVHLGDGTATICRDYPAIFTCSIHCQSNFPFRKHRSDLDVPLPDHVGDDDSLECLDALRPENYDLILFQAGVDALAEDVLGRLSLTRDGLKRRNERVLDLHERHGIPIALFMGGGYANSITPTVDAFEDLFIAAAKSQQNRGGSAPTSR